MNVRKLILILTCLALPATPALPEEAGWKSGFHLPGLNGGVSALATYEDALVVSGEFTYVGPMQAQGAARWKDDAWTPFGSELYGANVLFAFGGHLYAGLTNGMEFNGRVYALLRSDGNAWLPMGEGSANDAIHVHALTEFQGSLIVGGRFDRVGLPAAKNISRFDGTSWSSLGTGIRNPELPAGQSIVQALTVYNGELIAGGRFDQAGGALATNLARWDGAEWRPVGQLPTADIVSELVVHNETLWIRAGTKFYTWNGTVLAVAPGTGGLLAVHDGNLFSVSSGTLLEWTGSSWQIRANASTDGGISNLHSFGGSLVAAGGFTTIAGLPARNIALWNGSSWRSMDTGGGNGIPGTRGVLALTTYDNDLIAGGTFLETEFVSTGIARLDDSGWHQVGSGLSGWVGALAQYNGELVAGGGFGFASATPVNYIARYDGIHWRPLGEGLYQPSGAYVRALQVHDGKLYAGGFFTKAGTTNASNVACWDGTAWNALSTGANGEVHAFTEYQGDLIAGGSFTQAGFSLGPVVRWTGSEWLRVGDGPDVGSYGVIRALAVSNGQLYAAGFHSPGQGGSLRMFRLNGTHWQQLQSPPIIGTGGGEVSALADIGGSLIAAGNFREGVMCWNGATWESFDGGLKGGASALYAQTDGFYVGGYFTQAGEKPSYNIGRWSDSDVPVTLLSFAAAWENGVSRIRWQIAGDRQDVSGFVVWREGASGTKTPVSNVIPIAGETYELGDAEAPSEGCRYWLSEVGRTGEVSWHGPIELGPRRTGFRLYQNEPNPFRTSTRIAFDLGQEAHCDLAIFDAAGRRIATLNNGILPQGKSEVIWNGRDEHGRLVPSGVYFYRLRTPAYEVSKRLVVKSR